MKEIKLIISDDVYRDLKNALTVKWLSQMAGQDVTLAVIEKILRSLDNNEETCELIYKDRKKGK
ncbi:MAG TPA: hypothetical protein P5293_06600 [Bacteroidales bacterium]|nr:hypothetical protein [Bacteroidales bacterium]